MAQAAQAASVDGWGPYKLGMTLDAVRAMPGVQWTQPKITDVPGRVVTSFEAAKPVEVFGEPYRLKVYFEKGVLGEISLSRKTTNCEGDFLDVLGKAEDAYGVFEARDAARPRTLMLTFYSTVEVATPPGSPSHYSRKTIEFPDDGTPAYNLVTLAARHASGTDRLDIITAWDTKQGTRNCGSVSMDFVRD